jgi:glycosyltransferase EpsD
MKKVLFVATVVKKHINVFHLPYLKWFKQNGYEVHVCARNDFEEGEDCRIPYCDKYFNLPFVRSPFNSKNVYTYRKLKELIGNNNYDIIHCHTPMGGVLTRLAAKKFRKLGTKIIYTAHGFHFFKGAPLKNWLIYYPVEKVLSRYTDYLVTINNEDYSLAKSRFNRSEIKLVKGVGIEIEQFSPEDTEKKNIRMENGFSKQDFILIYVAELSFRKNQELLINSINLLKEQIPEIKLLLVGSGDLREKYEKQVISLGLEEHVIFTGFRKDVNKLMKLSDLAVSSSRQEGLPVNVMEAMSAGLPIVVSNCRGNRDLVIDGENGYLVNSEKEFSMAIKKLYSTPNLMRKFGLANLKLVREYAIDNVLDDVKEIYKHSVNKNVKQ